jgi:uncharacterized protein (DUF608 family)
MAHVLCRWAFTLSSKRKRGIKLHRRDFFLSSVLPWVASRGMFTHPPSALARGSATASSSHLISDGNQSRNGRLFPAHLVDDAWVQFSAEGFSKPVCGLIHNRAHPAVNGMSLGGIATGYVELETDGTFANSSLFNSGVPLKPWNRPFLAVRLQRHGTWLLTTGKAYAGYQTARDISYWGHYPVADLEFETDAPVEVGLRAWAPFIPGDAAASNTPGIIFEVHLRNRSRVSQRGTLVFSFPGPTQAEAQIGPNSLRQKQTLGWYNVFCPVAQDPVPVRRERVEGAFNGMTVGVDNGTGYALGIIGKERLHFGRAIGQVEGYPEETAGEWNAGVQGPAGQPFILPPFEDYDLSASLAVDFELQAGEAKTVRIVLAWYSPVWRGDRSNTFTRMYATRFSTALEVAQVLARQHESLLRRVLAWQEVIYCEISLPVWLREALVNVLYMISKTGYWAAAKPPIGSWCHPELGLFGMTESIRECPQIECIPCSFYGNVPLVLFFPELALSTLYGYKAYQFPSGTVPWIFGGITGSAAAGYRETDGADMATPSPGYQITLNGACYVDMLDRYWLRSGRDEIIREFYASVKKNTIFTMNLRPGPEGVISVPAKNLNPLSAPLGHGSSLSPGAGLDWFEGNGWFGMTPHVGGIHIAQIKMAQRMARKIGDNDFVHQCQKWIDEGSKLMEEKLWTGRYYLAYYEPETGKKSDWIFSAQLDGEWMVRFHGMEGVFAPPRVETTLDTILRACVPHTPFGVINFTQADGSLVPRPGYGPYGMFVPEVYMFSMLLMYAGLRDEGLEIARACVYNLSIVHRYSWTQPNVIRGDTGARTYGTDYYQNMMLWGLPAAIQDTDIAGLCKPGGLVDRVLQAGRTA